MLRTHCKDKCIGIEKNAFTVFLYILLNVGYSEQTLPTQIAIKQFNISWFIKISPASLGRASCDGRASGPYL